jgi:hypothetical protein
MSDQIRLIIPLLSMISTTIELQKTKRNENQYSERAALPWKLTKFLKKLAMASPKLIGMGAAPNLLGPDGGGLKTKSVGRK